MITAPSHYAMTSPTPSKHFPAYTLFCAGLAAVAWLGCAGDDTPAAVPTLPDIDPDRGRSLDATEDLDDTGKIRDPADHVDLPPREPPLPNIDPAEPTLATMRVTTLVWQPQPTHPFRGQINRELRSAIEARTLNIIFKHLPSAEAGGEGRLDLHGSGTCSSPQLCDPGPRTAATTISQPADRTALCELSVAQIPGVFGLLPFAPCVRGDATDVELVLGTLGAVPLESVEIVASHQGGQLPSGLLVGFLRESVAASLPTGVPVFNTVARVLGSADRTTFNGAPGWWLPFTFTTTPL